MTSPSVVASTSMVLRDLPDDQDLVLAGRRLRPGVVLAETSRFGEDVWRLEPVVLQQHVSSMMLNFGRIPDRYRLHAKQLCYAMLSGPLPAGEKRQSPVGIRGTLKDLRRFLIWLHTRPAGPGRPSRPALGELTARDLADYHRYLLGIRNAGTRELARRAVRLLWRYRHGLRDPLPFDPRDLEDWARHSAQRPAENSTDRIPEPILGPLIAWALRFVDDFATDILAAEEALQDHRSRFANGRLGRNTGFREDLQSYLDSHLREGRPLPGHQGRPNLQYIAVDAGTHARQLSRPALREMVLAVAAKVGTTDHTWLPTPVRGHLDGRPWLDGIALQHPSRSVHKLARMLQVACYVVIAFLSGMRDSEIKHLRRGCLRVQRGADGQPYRWKLTGLAFKGEPNPAGTPATWVVGHPAARAVEVLEGLQPPGQPLLFGHLPHAPGGIAASPTRALTTKATNARFAGTVLTDPRRLTRLMRRQDPAVYPGTFAACVFQPDKALCQQQRDLGGTTRPGLGDCRPLECGNVALTTDNLTALRVELDHVDDETRRAAEPAAPARSSAAQPTRADRPIPRPPHPGDQVTRRTVLPSHDDVQLAIKRLTEDAGKPPTVLAVARHLGLPNTTFRRHFPDITTELTQQRTPAPAGADPVAASRFEKIQQENTELRHARRELAEHLELAIANIQRLTLDNHHLRQQLHAATKVTHINTRTRS